MHWSLVDPSAVFTVLQLLMQFRTPQRVGGATMSTLRLSDKYCELSWIQNWTHIRCLAVAFGFYDSCFIPTLALYARKPVQTKVHSKQSVPTAVVTKMDCLGKKPRHEINTAKHWLVEKANCTIHPTICDGVPSCKCEYMYCICMGIYYVYVSFITHSSMIVQLKMFSSAIGRILPSSA